MELKTSQALKQFKKEAGQINHMFITLYVGLDGIVPYDLSPSPTLHTTWNPKSKGASVERSKIFARKATIAWLADCVDMYFHTIDQSPMLFLPDDIKRSFDDKDNSRSIYRRFNLLNARYHLSTVHAAFVDLLICWRNRMVHYSAENDIMPSSRKILEDNAEIIAQDFCGLDILEMLKQFHSGEVPTFKEVTAFVRAATNYIKELDAELIRELDLERYADRILIHYLREGKKNTRENINPRINNIFSKTSDAKKRMLQQLLMQNGFSFSEKTNKVDEFCERISLLGYTAANMCLEEGSFLQ